MAKPAQSMPQHQAATPANAEVVPAMAQLGAGSSWHRTVITLVIFVAAWELISFFTPEYILPGWGAILKRLVGLKFKFVMITGLRVLVALLASFLLGVLGAIVLYASRTAEEFMMPIVRLLMAVPVVCWILFAVLWFRHVEFRIGFVLVVICAPIFLIDVLDGMKGVPRTLRDMLRSFRPTQWEYFTKLILPATIPSVLTSWKVNLSLAIRVVTMAELVGAVSGIGYGMVIAQELFSIKDVFAWTIVLVIILLAVQAVVTYVEGRLLRWRE